jgi:hypothetical protein
MSEPTPFIVHCGECRHHWPAAYLPMPIERFAKVAASAICPFGCEGTVYPGEAQDNTYTLEQAFTRVFGDCDPLVPTPPNQYEKGK